MENKIISCEVCKEDIKIVKEVSGSSGSNKSVWWTSKEGVYFSLEGEIKKWFCNKCWKEIRR